jgi:hypothetical protein
MTKYKLLIQAVAGGTIYTSPVLSNAPAVYAESRREVRQFTTSDFILDRLPNTYRVDFAWDICSLIWAQQLLYLDKNIEYSLTWVGSDHRTKTIYRAKIYLTVIPNAQYIDKRSVRITATVLELIQPVIPDPAPNTYAWYKPETLTAYADGDRVSVWPDSSGNIVGAGDNRRLLEGSANLTLRLRANIVNGLDAVEWLGGNGAPPAPSMFMVNGFSSSMICGFIVIKMIEYPISLIYSLGLIGSNPSPGVFALAISVTGIVYIIKNQVVNVALNNTPLSLTDFCLLFWSYNRSTGDYRFKYNGVDDGSGTNSISFAESSVLLGKADNNYLSPELRAFTPEWIFYDRILSDSEIEATESYLISKYGIG